MYKLQQHSGDTLDYTFNLAAEDGTNDGTADDTGFLQGDTIASASWSIASGATVAATSYDDTSVTAWLSGGSDGKDYAGTVTVTTDGGRTVVIPFRLRVRDQ